MRFYLDQKAGWNEPFNIQPTNENHRRRYTAEHAINYGNPVRLCNSNTVAARDADNQCQRHKRD